MPPSNTAQSASGPDWLAFARRSATGVAAMLEAHPLTADRAPTTGRGEGGDNALVIDRGAEDVVFAELEALGVGLTAISEERGHVDVRGGGETHVVIDPIDGSLNAKRRLAPYCLSIAVASGPRMGDVHLAFVHDLAGGEEWWATLGAGATVGGAAIPPLDPSGPLEVLGVESASPERIASHSGALAATGAAKLRVVGSMTLAMCFVADSRLDAMASLAPCRSVDVAASQLIVRAAGGVVAFPDHPAGPDPEGVPLDLSMRSRVLAANGEAVLDGLLAELGHVDRAR